MADSSRLHCLLQYLLLLLLIPCFAAQPADHWNTIGQDALRNALNRRPNENPAKNVIIFIGDGMDIITTTASRIYKGQLKGNTGEEESLIWDTFPHVALSKTYNTDYQVADSAGTATAILSGVKTKFEVLGFDETVERGSCLSERDAVKVDSIIDDAIMEGKATGFVTTARVTHATPASAYAHVALRYWESDADLSDEAKENGCLDIATQLVNHGIQVAMGGGRRAFIPQDHVDPEYPDKYGKRLDGRNLTGEWLSRKRSANMSAEYVWGKTEFDAVNPETTDALLALFEPSHMRYEKDRANDGAGEPSIAEMTEKAIRILSKNENGFVLLVEGGRIDHGHHEGIAHSAITETLALDSAVDKALKLVDIENTLVVVTADHGHVMSMAGYPTRGNPILGLVDTLKGDDGLPFTTLGYMNGYGFRRVNQSFHETNMRPNLTGVKTDDPSFLQDALVPLYETWEETHGGQDVGIYAIGPMAHLFHGVQEQSYIGHVMKYAACVGENKDHCQSAGTTLTSTTSIVISISIPFLWNNY